MSLKKKKKKFNYKRIFSFRYFIYDFIKWTGFWSVSLWYRPKKYYINKNAKHNQNSGVFIASNHVGFTDPLFAHYVFLGKRLWIYALKSLFDTKFKKWFFTNINALEVDRENFSIDTYRKTKELIEAGKNICIFWEGHISHNEGNKIADMKSGVAFMSMINKAPVIPIMIVPRKHWYQRIKLIIGEEVRLYEMFSATPTQEEIVNACEYLKTKSNELVDYYTTQIKKGDK